MLSMALSTILSSLAKIVFIFATVAPVILQDGVIYQANQQLQTNPSTGQVGFYNCALSLSPNSSWSGAIQVFDSTANSVVTVAGAGGSSRITSMVSPGLYFFAVPSNDAFFVQSTTWTSGTLQTFLLCPYVK